MMRRVLAAAAWAAAIAFILAVLAAVAWMDITSQRGGLP